jgi:cytochrome c oxidase subunit 3
LSATAIPHDIEPHPLTGMYNGKFGIWLFLASEVMLFGALFSTFVLLRVGAPEGTWPHHGSEILNVPLATFNTAVLISSSVTMVMSWASLKMKNIGKAQFWLTLTFLLAGTFLVVKYFEYKAKFDHYMVVLNEPITLEGEPVTKVTGHHLQETDEGVVIEPDAPGAHGGEAHHAELKIDKANVKRMSNFGPRGNNFLAVYFTMTGLHGLHIIGGMVVIFYFMVTGRSQWGKWPEKYTNRIECTGLYWHFVDLVWIFLFPSLYLL